jgi:hypothetical protein
LLGGEGDFINLGWQNRWKQGQLITEVPGTSDERQAYVNYRQHIGSAVRGRCGRGVPAGEKPNQCSEEILTRGNAEWYPCT